MSARNESIAEPLGGKPPGGEPRPAPNLADQLLRHRATEAVLWSMPAVSAHGFIRGSASCGGGPNSAILFSRPLGSLAELLTPDPFYPRLFGFTDLRHGPVVVKIPPDSEKVRIVGQFVDHWQGPVVHVAGAPSGQALLLVPPGHNSPVPAEFLAVPSPSYRLVWAIRSIPAANASWEEATDHARKIEIFYLETPKATEFIDPADMRFSTLPRYDEQWFSDLDSIIQIEPVHRQDMAMLQMLVSLGIEKGKPFTPDARALLALRRGAIDAYYYMQEQVFGSPGFAMTPCSVHADIRENCWTKDNSTTFAMVDRLDYDARALRYFVATFDPENGSAGNMPRYSFILQDHSGAALAPDTTYKIKLPESILQRRDWALAVYDRATCAFIYSPSGKNAISFGDIDKLRRDDDGLASIYVGPECPNGFESNWIDSCGKHILPCMIYFGSAGEGPKATPWKASYQPAA